MLNRGVEECGVYWIWPRNPSPRSPTTHPEIFTLEALIQSAGSTYEQLVSSSPLNGGDRVPRGDDAHRGGGRDGCGQGWD